MKKYNLGHGQACLAGEEHMPIYKEIFENPKGETTPGGAALNTIRAANFMLKEQFPNSTTYFGCIGEDEYGSTMEKCLEKEGVKGMFHKVKDTPTGTCACVIYNKERSLVTNLSACLQYPFDHLKDNIVSLLIHSIERSC